MWIYPWLSLVHAFAKQLAILGEDVVAENSYANLLPKVMSVTLILDCRLKNRTQSEQKVSIYNFESYETFNLNWSQFNTARKCFYLFIFFWAPLLEERKLKKTIWCKGFHLRRSTSHTFHSYGFGQRKLLFQRMSLRYGSSESPKKGLIVFRKAAFPHRKGSSMF